jgi:hypothetical protein
MIETTVKLYRFEELEESVREGIVSRYRETRYDWPWSEDWLASLKAFIEKVPGVKLVDWSLDFLYSGHGDVVVEYGYDRYHVLGGSSQSDPMDDDEVEAMAALFGELWEYSLTGYVGDGSLLPEWYHNGMDVKEAIQGVSIIELLRDCVGNWHKEACEDYEYFMSEESILEDISCNDHLWYTEDGEVWRGKVPTP